MTGTDIALIITAFSGMLGAIFAGIAAQKAEEKLKSTAQPTTQATQPT